MNHLYIASFLFVYCLLSNTQSYADEKLIAGTISCSAEWNELCEDKKIISVPENYRLCRPEIAIAEKKGDADYQTIASDQKSITVYFRAKGNHDRLKPQGASIKLNIELFGIEETNFCEESTPAPTVEAITPAISPPPVALPAAAVSLQVNPHACACSQWLNWMKVEHCLTKDQRSDRPPCDSYEVTIQCVSSKDECRSIQRDNCPQIVGLNQSTSLKRLFIENSPYCLQ